MTSVSEFIKFLKILGKENLNRLYIIPCRRKSKRPLVGRGESWLEKRITIKKAVEMLRKGYNIAFVAKPDGLLFIDVDNRFEIINRFPDTLVVETNKGYHLYYFNTGIKRNYRFGVNYEIEVRANNQYVVGVGSEVEKVYRVKRGKISAINAEDIRKALVGVTNEYGKYICKGRCV